ncbi:MAG: histidinol phosphate phosphatase domain-containing protein [Candidatus Omnitrophica bacterium]|nr:histidinol phosphate phosphatase domain-containing protein [Candidatus Omnitrophota bacterium]
MIDLHTHTLFSDGELLPSELVRRAEVKGYKVIALTDHVDASNIDFVLPRIIKVCKVLNKFWNIRAIPGVEITHVPVQEIKGLVKFARKKGAKIVVVHGETVAEPVIPGTNRAAIEAGCDILAHPGLITEKDAELARRRGVYLEITTRKNHCRTNKRLFKIAKKTGAKLVVNNDTHSEMSLKTKAQTISILRAIGMTQLDIYQTFKNSEEIVRNKKLN